MLSSQKYSHARIYSFSKQRKLSRLIAALLFLLIFAFVFLLFSSRAAARQITLAAASVPSSNQATFKTIIIDNYSPYTFINGEGLPDGYSVDLMKAVAQVMGITLDIRVDTWDNARLALENGQIDFLPMMAYSADRDQLYDFSPAHTIAFDAFFTRKNSSAIRSINDLQGKTIIVMKGDQAYDYLLSLGSIRVEQSSQLVRQAVPGTTSLLLVDGLPEALRLLASGTGDTALMPKLVGLALIRDSKLTNLEPSPVVVEAYNRPFSFAVREGNLSVLERLNQGISIVKATGRYDEIYKKWFGTLEPVGIPVSTLLYYLGGASLVIIIIGVMLLLWLFSLKKQVAARTKSLEIEIQNRKKAEQSLRESNDKFESLVANVPGYIAYVNASTLQYEVVNDAFEKSFGIPHEKIIGSHIKEVIGETNFQFATKYIEEALSGKSVSYENIFHLVSGKRWMKVNYAPALDANGQVASIVVLSFDITEIKQAEAETRKSQEKLAATLDALPDLLFEVGLDGFVYDYHSPRTELLYRPLGDILGKTIPDILPANIASVAMSAIQEAHETGYSNGKQYELDVAIGTLWFEISVSRKVSSPDEPHFIVLSRDITARKRVEDALRESQARYQLVFENSGTANAIFDTQCRLILQNSLSAQNLDAKPGEVLGKKALEIFGPEQGLAVTERMQRVLSTGVTEFFETFFDLPTGEKWFRSTYQPIFDELKTLVGVQVISQDISQYKLAEESLRNSDSQLRKAQHFAHIGSWTWNIKTNQLDWSDEMYAIFGLDKSTFSGGLSDVIAQAIHPDDHARVDQSNLAVVNEGKPSPLEYRIIWKDGSIHTVWAEAGEMIRDEAGAPALLSGTVQEITERKRAEDSLRKSEERLRLSLQAANQGLYDLNLETGQAVVNSEYALMLGYDPETFAETNSAWIERLHPDDQAAATKALGDYTNGLIPEYQIEYRQKMKDGSWKWIMSLGKVVEYNLEGKPLRMIGTHTDITERKRAEALIHQYTGELEARVDERTADLSRVNSELARALRARDEFLASMSHELRTPLTSILGLSESLQAKTYGDLNERQQKTLQTIEGSGRHLLDLINDILDLSKIEAGKLELQVSPCSLADVCQASIQLAKGMAYQKMQSVEYSPAAEPVILQADARRLKQILVNLLGNAIKFTPLNGELGLDVKADAAGQTVSLTVWDMGIGIKAEDLHKLFNPFVQIDSSLARQYPGTGLGLSLVQRLTEMHRGGIQVESVFGQGSRFTITLPWAAHEKELVFARIDREDGELSAAVVSPEYSKLPRVMIADDNEIVLQMIADFLEAVPFRLMPVRSGAELLERVAEFQPDILLIDIQMPGLSGLETIRLLRSHSDAHIAMAPVVAVTALAMPGDREMCLRAGANEYVSKPIKLNDLVIIIQKLLEGKL